MSPEVADVLLLDLFHLEHPLIQVGRQVVLVDAERPAACARDPRASHPQQWDHRRKAISAPPMTKASNQL